jgi:anti-sigma factor RsiW
MNAGGTTPTPERLAAYADGELHGAERAAVEAWLDVCPQARADVEALRRLACQCRRTSAPEPSLDAWDAVLNRLHTALPSDPRPLPFPRPTYRPLVPAAAAAAAVILAAALGRVLWTTPQAPPAAPTTLTESLELADARDVEIISIERNDAETLLVGQAPVREALLLAGPNDVTFEGVVPGLRRNGAAPIIFPLDAAESP